MEYVLVVYPTNRQVYVNGESCGRTNCVFRVDPGTHIFNLGTGGGYEPLEQTILVENTSAIEPLEICFERKAR
jgi:hypothetical protein